MESERITVCFKIPETHKIVLKDFKKSRHFSSIRKFLDKEKIKHNKKLFFVNG